MARDTIVDFTLFDQYFSKMLAVVYSKKLTLCFNLVHIVIQHTLRFCETVDPIYPIPPIPSHCLKTF